MDARPTRLRPKPRPRAQLGLDLITTLALAGTILVGAGALGGAADRGGGGPGGPAPTDPSTRPTPPRTSPTPTPSLSPTPSPLPTPSPSPTPSPLPACRYADIEIEPPADGDWSLVVLDTIVRLPRDYVPEGLVDTGTLGLNGGFRVAGRIATDLARLAAAAREAGLPIEVVSAYRSFDQQKATFARWVSIGGLDEALRTSARAGHSEHQLGTAVDLTSRGGPRPWELADWSTTPTGSWVREHAWRFGFVMSYPRGGEELACYDHEPWHYRWVGRELAAQIHETGAVPRQVLWDRELELGRS